MQEYRNKNVLVTGGAGFIGSHLAERLIAAGAIVTVFDNLCEGKLANLSTILEGHQFIQGDVRNIDDMDAAVAASTPDYVFHLAANASVPGSVADPLYDFDANANGTLVVLESLRRAGIGAKVVSASSGAVYGQPHRFPIVENDPIDPISPYGASKASAELIAMTHRKTYGTNVTIARLFNTYGPRMARFVVLDFLRKLQVNPARLEILGSGQQVRDFTYVADTVEGLCLLAVRGEPGMSYNVSSGENCTVTELALELISLLGLSERTEITYTGQSWTGDAQRWEVSISRLKSLGYMPGHNLRCGLSQVIAWFECNGMPRRMGPPAVIGVY